MSVKDYKLEIVKNLITLAIADSLECIDDIHSDEAESEVETIKIVLEKLQAIQSLLTSEIDRDSAELGE